MELLCILAVCFSMFAKNISVRFKQSVTVGHIFDYFECNGNGRSMSLSSRYQ